MVLSLYSSRLVLSILGVEDFGIYTLVAGIVSMLSFLTNSLIGSTQRFLSVNQGKGDNDKLKVIFSNSLLLHIVIGFVIAIILETCTPFLFSGFLNIPENRIGVAKLLYQQVIWMVYISFIASPFRALLVSRENIVYTSVIDVLDGVLKVGCVLLLPLITLDKLCAYGWIMFGIQFFNLLAFLSYCFVKYEECILPRFNLFSWSYVKDLFVYTGWIVYSTMIIAFRNQGVALIINKFHGVAVNAAYGIGNQLSGMVAFVSSSFTNAISPQLMAAEGSGNRGHMLRLAEIQSKYSFLLLAMLTIPTIFEMETLLSVWLGNVPENAVLFSRMFLIMQTVDQLSSGLGQANRAIGKIGKYTIVTYTPKLLILPIGWLLLQKDFPLYILAILMVCVEYFCMLLRISSFRGTSGFSVSAFCKYVLLDTAYPVIITICVCIVFTCHCPVSSFRFLVTYILSVTIFLLSTYVLSIDKNEKHMFKNMVGRVKIRKNKDNY